MAGPFAFPTLLSAFLNPSPGFINELHIRGFLNDLPYKAHHKEASCNAVNYRVGYEFYSNNSNRPN